MDIFELVRQRLNSHGITHKRHNTAEDVTTWMGAMQAQNYHQALWAIG